MSFILLLMLSVNAFAATSDANEAVVLDQPCSLEVVYKTNEVAFSGLNVTIWQVAVLHEDFTYTAHEDFAPYAIDLASLKTTSEFDRAATTLYGCAVADGIGGLTTRTDAEGKAVFTGLSCGLYLVAPIRIDNTYFSAMLVAVPGIDAEGSWVYDVTSIPKSETKPTDPTDPTDPPDTNDVKYQVNKLWKDQGYEAERPQSVTVQIYRDGVFVEEIILSDENDWTYQWTAADDGSFWTVVERDVPEGYTMTVTEKAFSFIIENRRPSDQHAPQTGDNSNITLYLALMALSLTGLVTLLFHRKREQAK